MPKVERYSSRSPLLALVVISNRICDRERTSLVSQLTLDCLDFWIPATNLGYASLNDGAIGAIG